jgi:hypothetical protein
MWARTRVITCTIGTNTASERFSITTNPAEDIQAKLYLSRSVALSAGLENSWEEAVRIHCGRKQGP